MALRMTECDFRIATSLLWEKVRMRDATQSNKVAEPLAAQSSKDVIITCTCFVGK